MTSSDAFKQFPWSDKYGFIWDVVFYPGTISFSGYADPVHTGEPNVIHVRTHLFPSQKLSVARLEDVRVNCQFENRGIGFMLVRTAISECKRRGHNGIEGNLGAVDRGHLPKLIHFYEKLGFSVVLYDEEQIAGIGEIEMAFQ